MAFNNYYPTNYPQGFQQSYPQGYPQQQNFAQQNFAQQRNGINWVQVLNPKLYRKFIEKLAE